jgi:hypothetical protein
MDVVDDYDGTMGVSRLGELELLERLEQWFMYCNSLSEENMPAFRGHNEQNSPCPNQIVYHQAR